MKSKPCNHFIYALAIALLIPVTQLKAEITFHVEHLAKIDHEFNKRPAIEFEADDDTPIIGQVTRRDKKISDALVRCGLHSEYEDGHYVQRLYISEPMTVRVSQDVYDEALRQINLTNLYMTPVRRHQRRH